MQPTCTVCEPRVPEVVQLLDHLSTAIVASSHLSVNPSPSTVVAHDITASISALQTILQKAEKVGKDDGDQPLESEASQTKSECLACDLAQENGSEVLKCTVTALQQTIGLLTAFPSKDLLPHTSSIASAIEALQFDGPSGKRPSQQRSLPQRINDVLPKCHERVRTVLEKLVENCEKHTNDKAIVDVDVIRETLDSFAVAGAVGSVSKYGGDDLTTVNATDAALKEQKLYDDGYEHQDIFAAIEEIELKRAHDYAMCLMDECYIICRSDTESLERHLATHKKKKAKLAEGEVPSVDGERFRHPTTADLRMKAERFWETTFPERGGPSKYPNVTKNVAVALYLYTLETELYADMNWGLRTHNEGMIKRYAPLIYHLMQAYEQIPKHELLISQLYRGLNINLREQYNGLVFMRWPAFSSTTASYKVVQEFVKSSSSDVDGSIFLLRCRNGILISTFSEFPKEDEVLLPPNTLLKIEGEVPTGSKELLSKQIGISLAKVFLCEVRDATQEDIANHASDRSAFGRVLELTLMHEANTPQGQANVERALNQVEDASLDWSIQTFEKIAGHNFTVKILPKLRPNVRSDYVYAFLKKGTIVQNGIDILNTLPNEAFNLEKSNQWSVINLALYKLFPLLMPKLKSTCRGLCVMQYFRKGDDLAVFADLVQALPDEAITRENVGTIDSLKLNLLTSSTILAKFSLPAKLELVYFYMKKGTDESMFRELLNGIPDNSLKLNTSNAWGPVNPSFVNVSLLTKLTPDSHAACVGFYVLHGKDPDIRHALIRTLATGDTSVSECFEEFLAKGTNPEEAKAFLEIVPEGAVKMETEDEWKRINKSFVALVPEIQRVLTPPSVKYMTLFYLWHGTAPEMALALTTQLPDQCLPLESFSTWETIKEKLVDPSVLLKKVTKDSVIHGVKWYAARGTNSVMRKEMLSQQSEASRAIAAGYLLTLEAKSGFPAPTDAVVEEVLSLVSDNTIEPFGADDPQDGPKMLALWISVGASRVKLLPLILPKVNARWRSDMIIFAMKKLKEPDSALLETVVGTVSDNSFEPMDKKAFEAVPTINLKPTLVPKLTASAACALALNYVTRQKGDKEFFVSLLNHIPDKTLPLSYFPNINRSLVHESLLKKITPEFIETFIPWVVRAAETWEEISPIVQALNVKEQTDAFLQLLTGGKKLEVAKEYLKVLQPGSLVMEQVALWTNVKPVFVPLMLDMRNVVTPASLPLLVLSYLSKGSEVEKFTSLAATLDDGSLSLEKVQEWERHQAQLITTVLMGKLTPKSHPYCVAHYGIKGTDNGLKQELFRKLDSPENMSTCITLLLNKLTDEETCKLILSEVPDASLKLDGTIWGKMNPKISGCLPDLVSKLSVTNLPLFAGYYLQKGTDVEQAKSIFTRIPDDSIVLEKPNEWSSVKVEMISLVLYKKLSVSSKPQCLRRYMMKGTDVVILNEIIDSVDNQSLPLETKEIWAGVQLGFITEKLVSKVTGASLPHCAFEYLVGTAGKPNRSVAQHIFTNPAFEAGQRNTVLLKFLLTTTDVEWCSEVLSFIDDGSVNLAKETDWSGMKPNVRTALYSLIMQKATTTSRAVGAWYYLQKEKDHDVCQKIFQLEFDPLISKEDNRLWTTVPIGMLHKGVMTRLTPTSQQHAMVYAFRKATTSELVLELLEALTVELKIETLTGYQDVQPYLFDIATTTVLLDKMTPLSIIFFAKFAFRAKDFPGESLEFIFKKLSDKDKSVVVIDCLTYSGIADGLKFVLPSILDGTIPMESLNAWVNVKPVFIPMYPLLMAKLTEKSRRYCALHYLQVGGSPEVSLALFDCVPDGSFKIESSQEWSKIKPEMIQSWLIKELSPESFVYGLPAVFQKTDVADILEAWLDHCIVRKSISLKPLKRNPADENSPLSEVEYLSLEGCSGVTDALLAMVGKCLPNLQQLNVSGCANITSDGVVQVGKLCPMLQGLNVKNCKGITDDAVVFDSLEKVCARFDRRMKVA